MKLLQLLLLTLIGAIFAEAQVGGITQFPSIGPGSVVPADITLAAGSFPCNPTSGSAAATNCPIVYTPAQTLSYYGAVPGGIADQSTAIQNWINYLEASDPSGICNVPGTYNVASSILVSQIRSLNLVMYGCSFVWTGASTTAPMWEIQNVAYSSFYGGTIQGSSSKQLAEAFRIDNSGSGVTSSHNLWQDTRIEGTAGYINYAFRNDVVGPLTNQNNDFMQFEHVTISNTAVAAFSIEGDQAVGWKMHNTTVNSNGNGQYAVSGGASVGAAAYIDWDGGFVGSNTTADFRFKPPASPNYTTHIKNLASEGSARLLQTDQSGGTMAIVLESVNWDSSGINADHKAMLLQSPGPYTFINCGIGSSTGVAMTVSWGSQFTQNFTPPVLDLIDTTFQTSVSTTATLFLGGTAPTLAQNSWIRNGNSTFVAIVPQNLAYNASSFTATSIGSPSVFSVTPVGTTGVATWTYKVVGIDAAGNHTAVSGATSTTTGNATLNGTNYNAILLVGGAGAVQYQIYRTASGGTPSTTGLIATVISVGGNNYTYNDQGAAGDSSTAPTTATTGYFNGPIGGSPFVALTDNTTVTWAIGSVQFAAADLTFTVHSGSRTLNITGPLSGGSYVLWIKQDGTGGEGLTLGSGCTWKVSGGGSGAITPSVGANAVDVLAFTYDGTNCYANFNKNFN